MIGISKVKTKPLNERISVHAKSLGFDDIAFVSAERLARVDDFDRWISEGRHGSMSYMENYREVRDGPKALESWAVSAIVCLTRYTAGSDLLENNLRIARYAQGGDYHEILRKRTQSLAHFIHSETGSDVITRATVDTAPLLERPLAEISGIGWIGKNAMLISQSLGSFTFISTLLVGMDLVEQVREQADRCGSCSACIDACPTGAIISPQVIDARRCIAYLTIENRGPISRDLRPLIQDFWFGCDLCQTVCPWNGEKSDMDTDEHFVVRDVYKTLAPADILTMSREKYVEWFRKSAIKRAKYEGLKRNAAVVLGNLRTGLQILLSAFELEESNLVKGHIIWAIGQFEDEHAQSFLKNLSEIEDDPYLRDELEYILGYG